MTIITSDKSFLYNKEINFIDMHHHSTFSDGSKSPEEIISLAKKLNKGVCITDHNKIKGSLIAIEKNKIFTIPSIEITSKESKDILVYFHSKKDLTLFWERNIKNNIKNNRLLNMNKTNLPLVNVLEKIKDYNGVSVLAHPFAMRPKKSNAVLKNKNILKNIDAIETHNFLTGHYKKTVKFAKKYNLPMTAGSDSHSLSRFNVLTGTYSFNIDDFLKDLVLKKTIIYFEKKRYMKTKLKENFIALKKNMHIRKAKLK